jgi:hypothetical protein
LQGLEHRGPIGLIFECYVRIVVRCATATVVVLLGLAAGTARAAVRPATLTLSVRSFPLVCGRVFGLLQVTLPRAFEVPSAIDTHAVRMNGVAARRVAVRGHTVILASTASHGVGCNVVSAAHLTVVFTRSASVGAPATGTYRVTVWHGNRAYRGTLTVSA